MRQDTRRKLNFVLCVAFAAPWSAGCAKRAAPPVQDVVMVPGAAIPADPGDAAWQAAPQLAAQLILQDLVEPRQMVATTPEVRVRALVHGGYVAFRLEWTDATPNDLPGSSRFCDACAIQLPTRIEASIPAPQMGEAGRGVEISYWNAAWQAVVDGRGDSIKDIFPNASVDHYPFEAAPLQSRPAIQQEVAARYSPARALGNRMGGPRKSAVEDLRAEGPGTLSPAAAGVSKGLGRRTADGWAVVISRPLPEGLASAGRSQIAFAVWEGSVQEAGARKMRTGWINLVLQGKP